MIRWTCNEEEQDKNGNTSNANPNELQKAGEMQMVKGEKENSSQKGNEDENKMDLAIVADDKEVGKMT